MSDLAIDVIFVCGIAIGLVCICIFLCFKRNRNSTKPVPVPEATTLTTLENQNNIKQEVTNDHPFESGIWLARYLQDNQWYGPHQFSLFFDNHSMKVKGSRSDDVGIFEIDGIYSIETGELGLKKIYQANTGNPDENLRHLVAIELTWNADDEQFDGKWYIKTSEYDGEDDLQLKFDRPQ